MSGLSCGTPDCAVTTTPTDLVGVAALPIDPLLGPLQDNGGEMLTMALQAGSPAIDKGNLQACVGSLATDQIGQPRKSVCDIGAFEFQGGGCGNGVVEAGEACDDGNALNGDGCNNNCAPETWNAGSP